MGESATPMDVVARYRRAIEARALGELADLFGAPAPTALAPCVPPRAAENTALVRRYYDMWNRGDGSVADVVLSHGYVDHKYPDVLGPAATRAFAPRFRAKHPDVVMDAEVVAADAEYVAVRVTVRRTGEDRAVTNRGIAVFRVDGEQIAEQWSLWAAPKLGWKVAASPAPAAKPARLSADR